MKYIFFTLPLLLALSAEAKTLKVMQYNLENFFDTAFDEGTEDYTYLPLSVKKTIPNHAAYCKKITSKFNRNECFNLDWNEAKFTKKILNLSQVIKAYDKTGKGPDILFVEEVENVNVLNKLVSKGLDKMGYKHQVLIEGDDSRGIDVGLITKFPVISSKRHSIIFEGEKLDTRGILEVELDVDGNHVVVFVNHWPSQNNPTGHRLASAKLLAELAEKTKAELVIAAGDFNTIDSDKPHPFDFLKSFTDAEAEARRANVPMHPGSHYFQGEWGSLDRIFVYKNSALRANYQSFKFINEPFMMKRDNATGEFIPLRFDANSGNGFSDHLPLAIEFTY